MYEDLTMNYTTEELAKMEVVKINEPYFVIKLTLLGFNYCTFKGEYYFLATPELLRSYELIRSEKKA